MEKKKRDFFSRRRRRRLLWRRTEKIHFGFRATASAPPRYETPTLIYPTVLSSFSGAPDKTRKILGRVLSSVLGLSFPISCVSGFFFVICFIFFYFFANKKFRSFVRYPRYSANFRFASLTTPLSRMKKFTVESSYFMYFSLPLPVYFSYQLHFSSISHTSTVFLFFICFYICICVLGILWCMYFPSIVSTSVCGNNHVRVRFGAPRSTERSGEQSREQEFMPVVESQRSSRVPRLFFRTTSVWLV